MKLKIYKVDEKYISYLKQFDINVKLNKGEKRPYIGVVLEINNFKYFAPMASPKPKHKNMKNSLDFIKINEGNQGAINLNNMIPVIDHAIIIYDINSEPNDTYKQLLFDQVAFINKNSEKITTNAKKLYEKVTIYNSFLKERCVDFKLLEEKSLEFEFKDKVEIKSIENSK